MQRLPGVSKAKEQVCGGGQYSQPEQESSRKVFIGISYKAACGGCQQPLSPGGPVRDNPMYMLGPQM